MSKTVDDGSGLVSIGQLAKAAGVSSRTIRYYEELGILPEPRRSAGGTRKYPNEYTGYIAATLALKDLGFRLDEIKPLARLALGRSVSASQRDAAAQLVESRIEALARQVTVLRRLHDSVVEPDAVASVSAILGAGPGHPPASHPPAGRPPGSQPSADDAPAPVAQLPSAVGSTGGRKAV